MTYHILVMGDIGVGKTTYLHVFSAYTYDTKRQLHYATLMYADTPIRLYEYTPSLKYSMTPHNIYEHMDGVLVLFDITNTQSRRYAINVLTQIPQILPIVVIANKCDIPHRPISCGEEFIMVSAVDRVNLNAPLWSIVHKIQEKKKKSLFCYVRRSLIRRFTIHK